MAVFICLKPLCSAQCCSSTRAQLPQASLQCSAPKLSSPDYLTYVSLSCSCLKCPDGRGETEKYSIGRKPNTHWKSSCVILTTSNFLWVTLYTNITGHHHLAIPDLRTSLDRIIHTHWKRSCVLLKTSSIQCIITGHYHLAIPALLTSLDRSLLH